MKKSFPLGLVCLVPNGGTIFGVQYIGHLFRGGDCIEIVYTELIRYLYQNVHNEEQAVEACNQIH